MEAALVQAKLSPGLLAIESPEDLGALTSGPHRGTRPGSIWQWNELPLLRALSGVREFGLLQSDFGTPFLKPTRILLKGNPAEAVLFEGAPVFDQLGKYCGPIPKHSTDFSKFKSLAKAAGETGFRTTGTAAWPPPMCEWMAETLHNSWKNIDGVRGAVSALPKVDSPGAGPEAGPDAFGNSMEGQRCSCFIGVRRS